jgi:hypothetical protein
LWLHVKRHGRPLTSPNLVKLAPKGFTQCKKKLTIFLINIPMIPSGYHLGTFRVSQEKQQQCKEFLKNRMPMPIGISFFKVACKLLCSLHVPPNSLENISEVFIRPRMRLKEGGKALL